MYLGTGVNFINVLQPTLTRANPESTKNTVKLSVFFAHWVSAFQKLRRTLMKLTPGEGNFLIVATTETEI
jgi:hypothetical protein